MYSCKKVKRYRVSSSLQRSTKVRRFAKGLIFTKSDQKGRRGVVKMSRKHLLAAWRAIMSTFLRG